MHARHRSAIILGIVALALFIVRWPIDNSVCDPHQWKWRPSAMEGASFFTSVFRGGGGTPAIFAMLGGQRYMVANITWEYSDVLFHKGKLYEMVYPLESTVTLNPSFTEAWSTYGWHLAWNIYSDTDDPVEKKKWMDAGRTVYLRAIQANPVKPAHRFDLAWFYMQREGNYRKALNVLEPVVNSGEFKPLTPQAQADPTNLDVINERLWDPEKIGHGLGIVYQKLCIFTGDWSYLEKAINVYKECLKIDPNEKGTDKIIARLEGDMHDQAWLARQQAMEAQVRKNFGLPPIKFGQKVEQMFPDGDAGIVENNAE
ncbi:MAG TPA: hypothetical protein VHV83_00425 [Armatimonadota bacterium]|nr:hypothetical protein [Armatimonadota bacterium]